MAEVVAMRNNALPFPIYGVSFTIVVPLLDADGDPVSPSSPDSEVSKNGDTFADCTNEATEIATSSGVVYLTLTAAEMTADIVAVRIQSTGAKTTIVTLYPRKLVAISSGTCQGSNDTGDITLASGDSAIDDYYNGCLVVAVIDSTTEARLINDYVGSTKVAEIAPSWNTAQPDSDDTYTIYLVEGRHVSPVNVTHVNVAGASTFTGNVSMAAGMTITQSSSNTPGVSITGNGTGAGLLSTGGTTGIGISGVGGGTSGIGINAAASAGNSAGFQAAGRGNRPGIIGTGGATGHGISGVGGATSGVGIRGDGSAGNSIGIQAVGQGSAAGVSMEGGATGAGLSVVGGGTSGAGITVATTSGNGITLAPTAGHGISSTGNGTSKHGILVTGGTAGTSDGLAAVAGTGGVDIRGNITGNLVGTVSILATYTGNTPQTGDSYAVVNSVTFGNSALKTLIDTVDDFLDTEVAAIKAKTDNLPSDPADASDIAAAFSTVNSTLTTIAGYIDTEIGTIITRLGTPSDLGSGATLSANMVDIESQTDDIGTAGAGLTAIPWNASWDTEVQSECADALVAYDPPTEAEMNARTLAAASYATAANQTTITTHLTDIKGAGWTVTDTLEAIRDRGDVAWITATGFSTHTASDVWGVATRVLTAGTNIQLPSNGLANVTAWSVAITGNITGTVSGNSTHTAANVVTAMGTGTFLTAIPWNASWDTEVQSEAQDAIEANNLDHLLKLAVDTDFGTTVHLNSVVGYLADNGTTATFDRTTDSLEAIQGQLPSGSGTGARSVTITINDGATAIEGARVRVTQGVSTYVQTTNVSGVVSFALDDATWAVTVSKVGYTLASQSLIVNGTETVTYSMTAVALVQPVDPTLVSHLVLCTGADGEPEASAVIYYRITAGTGDVGYSRDIGVATATSDEDGYATLTFIVGARYSIWRGGSSYKVSYTASSIAPPETIGTP